MAAMPADFPHWRTIYDYASGWEKTGATETMHDELRRQCRIAAGRDPVPTAAITRVPGPDLPLACPVEIIR